jgi:transcriptional regulator with XRE-family HTH domain
MKIKVDSDKLRLWRKESCWSQEQVAEKANISIRTIQRIENGGMTSYDTVVSLANVFAVDVKDFLIDEDRQNEQAVENQKSKGLMGLKMSFGIHAVWFVIGIVTLLFIDLVDNPSHWWSIWPVGFWVIGFAAHGATVFMVGFIEKMNKQIQDLESAS